MWTARCCLALVLLIAFPASPAWGDPPDTCTPDCLHKSWHDDYIEVTVELDNGAMCQLGIYYHFRFEACGNDDFYVTALGPVDLFDPACQSLSLLSAQALQALTMRAVLTSIGAEDDDLKAGDCRTIHSVSGCFGKTDNGPGQAPYFSSCYQFQEPCNCCASPRYVCRNDDDTISVTEDVLTTSCPLPTFITKQCPVNLSWPLLGSPGDHCFSNCLERIVCNDDPPYDIALPGTRGDACF